jgi:uncharacterized protein YndB with AHSA1/START domain
MTGNGTISEFAEMSGATLLIQRWLPGPAERVWRYLTESDLRRKWLAAGDMALRPGAPLELIWRNDGLSDETDPRPEEFPEEQRLESRVVAVDPMRSLTIAWGKGDVTFALQEAGGRVLLTISHRGLDTRDASIAGGWHMHLDILAALLSAEKPGSFWAGWKKLRAHYEKRL